MVIDPGVEFGAPDDRIETQAGGLGFRLLNAIAVVLGGIYLITK